VEISKIDVEGTQFQSREKTDPKKVKDLARELKEDGQLTAGILYRFNDLSKPLAIIDCHHRALAAKSIGLNKVLARVIPESDMDIKTAFRLSVKQNLHNDSLKNKDIIFSCKRMSENGMNNVDIANDIGRSEGMVRKYLAAADSAHAKQVAEGSESLEHAIDNKKMYYKPLGNNGFNYSIKFKTKTDSRQELKAFLDKTVPELYKMAEETESKAEKREKGQETGNREKGIGDKEGNLTPSPLMIGGSKDCSHTGMAVEVGVEGGDEGEHNDTAKTTPNTTQWKTVSGSADDQKDVPDEIKKMIDAQNKQAGAKGLEAQKQQALQQREQMVEQKQKLASGSDLTIEEALKTSGHKREDLIKQSDEAIKRLDDYIKKLDEEIKKLGEGK
jgi:ParB-like chromosome segregation protein Spo0J